MQRVNATHAKNLLGKVIDDACSDLVMLERHGKEQIALMPANEARLCVLCAYALGVMPRNVAMKRLGFTWYGELFDAMQDAGLRVSVPDVLERSMLADIVKAMSGK